MLKVSLLRFAEENGFQPGEEGRADETDDGTDGAGDEDGSFNEALGLPLLFLDVDQPSLLLFLLAIEPFDDVLKLHAGPGVGAQLARNRVAEGVELQVQVVDLFFEGAEAVGDETGIFRIGGHGGVGFRVP